MTEHTYKVFNTADGSNVIGCVRASVNGFGRGIDKTRRSKEEARQEMICEG